MDLAEQTTAELQMRQVIGRQALRLLRRAEVNGEEGATAAVARYEGQLQEITQELRRRRREEREAQGVEKPPVVQIGLKVASLGAKGR